MNIIFAYSKVRCTKCGDFIKTGDPFIRITRGIMYTSVHFSCAERFPDVLGQFKSTVLTRLRIKFRSNQRVLNILKRSLKYYVDRFYKFKIKMEKTEKEIQLLNEEVDKLQELEKGFKYRYLDASILDKVPPLYKEDAKEKIVDKDLDTQKRVEKSLYKGVKTALVGNTIDNTTY